MPHRFFTLDEANGHLPWLRTLFPQLRELHRQLQEALQERQRLARGARGNGGSHASGPIRENQTVIQVLEQRMAELLRPVLDQGIIVRDPERGLVDFPALREGREVCLCWLIGEDEIRHWHEVDAGFLGRQPL